MYFYPVTQLSGNIAIELLLKEVRVPKPVFAMICTKK